MAYLEGKAVLRDLPPGTAKKCRNCPAHEKDSNRQITCREQLKGPFLPILVRLTNGREVCDIGDVQYNPRTRFY